MRMLLQLCSLSLAAVVLAFAAAPVTAHAQNTRIGVWLQLESGIDVKFTQVNADVCTWSIRNSTTTSTLRSMKLSVTHPDWKPGQVFNPYRTKTDTDVIPNPLGPGKAWGGWATYTAPGSCRYVTINVLQRVWANTNQAPPSTQPPQIKEQHLEDFGFTGSVSFADDSVTETDSHTFDAEKDVESIQYQNIGEVRGWFKQREGYWLVDAESPDKNTFVRFSFDNLADATAMCSFLSAKVPAGARISCKF